MEDSSTVEEHLHDGIERFRSTIVREQSGRSLARFSPYDDTELAEGALELAIVVPTFNEIENIDTLVVRRSGRLGRSRLRDHRC